MKHEIIPLNDVSYYHSKSISAYSILHSDYCVVLNTAIRVVKIMITSTVAQFYDFVQAEQSQFQVAAQILVRYLGSKDEYFFCWTDENNTS